MEPTRGEKRVHVWQEVLSTSLPMLSLAIIQLISRWTGRCERVERFNYLRFIEPLHSPNHRARRDQRDGWISSVTKNSAGADDANVRGGVFALRPCKAFLNEGIPSVKVETR